MSQPTGVQRPTGITILAVLAAIVGVLLLLVGLGAIGLSGAAGTASGLVLLAGLLALITAFIELAFAYGAWTLKPWAWVLGVVGAGLSLLQSILSVIGRGTLASEIVNIVIAAAILYYLNTPAVRRAFGRGPGQYFQQ
jgi:hypothetical protein